jgi:NAD(P)H dehydrogenase (quinone)
MSIVVTGATGHFGRLTVEALRRRGVPAEQIIATGRRIETLGDLAGQGIFVRRADYSDEASLREAFDGATRLLLVSGTEVGQRIRQHTNVITAAKAGGRAVDRLHQHRPCPHLDAAHRPRAPSH